MSKVPFTQYAQYTPLFTVREARERYGKDMHSRSLPNLLHRLKTQGRVRFLANGVYAGALAAAPPNRYRVPRALRDDAVVALHSALELHGVANQVFQTVYYFSAGARKDVVFDHVTYHRVAFPRALAIASHRLFQTELHADKLFFRGKIRDRFLRKLPRGVVYLAEKRPGNHWVPTWKLMVPETLLPSNEG